MLLHPEPYHLVEKTSPAVESVSYQSLYQEGRARVYFKVTTRFLCNFIVVIYVMMLFGVGNYLTLMAFMYTWFYVQ